MRMKVCLGLVPGMWYEHVRFSNETLGNLIADTTLPIPVTIEFDYEDCVGECIELTPCLSGGIDAILNLREVTAQNGVSRSPTALLALYAHVAPAYRIDKLTSDGTLSGKLLMVSFTANPAPCTLPEFPMRNYVGTATP